MTPSFSQRPSRSRRSCSTISVANNGTAQHNHAHYLGCSKTMAQIGRAFADAVLALRK